MVRVTSILNITSMVESSKGVKHATTVPRRVGPDGLTKDQRYYRRSVDVNVKGGTGQANNASIADHVSPILVIFM